uniref:Uncharacterized protein n=1 Tax=Anguilla anguilla TaxID=7936 RepID=A0A0E9Q7M0_ANGAN
MLRRFVIIRPDDFSGTSDQAGSTTAGD